MFFAYYTLDAVVYHGLGTYGVLLLSWVAACLPFHIMDHFGLEQHRRVQPKAERFGAGLAAKARAMVVLNWSWLICAVVAASPLLEHREVAESRGTGLLATVAPTACIAAKVALCFLIDDCSFYAYHRALHSHGSLYEHFHKPHHVFKAPFAWTSHAVHPVEMLLQSVGTMSGPLVLGMSKHELWAWLALRQLQGVLDHTGYDWPLVEFPGFGLAPSIFGGTAFHDDHHKYFNGNYASCFSFLDELFSTRLRASKL
eukprot:TRINITY_DN123405_c0_g1_i1.p1 TRINITY_DN123405_c0_g1~~TRINITY_DN123405_c0_g1_i1.p1  ORF type:complete len:256 (-),score=25.18 TRINITY_DN123405_c0_g1_i1:183-950(-)